MTTSESQAESIPKGCGEVTCRDEKKIKKITAPLDSAKIKGLRAGDFIYLSGTIYGARDMAHKKIAALISSGRRLPFDLTCAVMFYVGPSPTPPGKNSGSIGPTTSARMDSLTEPLLKKGLGAMIGKGRRAESIKEMCTKYRAVYFISIGGISALLASKVKRIKPIAFHDLGAEAVFEMEVMDFPLFVAYDIYGGDIFEDALRVE